MKNLYLSIGAFLLCGSLSMAQTPANRTTETVVADVLAQMPAGNQAKYNQLIQDLSNGGETTVLSLVKKINAPGQGSNVAVDYALSGLTHYVSAKGKESERLTVANAYLKALDLVNERETKAFIIRQLQRIGQDESVDKLGSYLTDESLAGPAASALAAIGSEKAGAVLLSALKTASNTKNKQEIVLAIGEAKITESEDVLQTLLGSGDTDLEKDVLYALSRVGTSASLKSLAEAAEKAGYTMEKTGANEAYIHLIKNVLSREDTKVAEKEAKNLLKAAKKQNQEGTRAAALGILLDAKGGDIQTVLDALKDPDKEYRNAALNYASGYATRESYIEIYKALQKAKPEVKVDLLNWIGRESKLPEKYELIKNLEVKFDLPGSKVLTNQVASSDFAVKQAAVWTLAKIGDEQFIPVLAGLLTSSDKQVVLLGQDALTAFKGDISPTVARTISSASDAGKIAGIELLATRKATSYINSVLEQVKSGTPEVKAAAYKALKDVASEKDFTLLCGMLETADAATVAPLQQAVITAVSEQPGAQQVKMVTARMLQAGSSKAYLYYTVLAATGEPKALALISDGFKKETGAARDAAFEALLTWKGFDVAGELYAVCTQPSLNSYFDRALDAYISRVSRPSLSGENRVIFLRKAMEIAKTDAQKNRILKEIGNAGTFLGLLYAGEFIGQPAIQQEAANAVMNTALNHPEYTGQEVKTLLNKVIDVLDNPDAGYQKEAIRKHLSEMPKEEGFVSIFNGKDLNGWKGLVENPIKRAQMKPAQLAKAQAKADEQMRKDWKVVDGLLAFDGAGFDNLCTEKQYGDFEMYIDWKLDPAGPEADAGIYLRGTPQVQIWDTSRVNVGAQVGSGGLYNNQVNESKPLKVADNELGEWNTFYIKMVGDRVTVRLNGELVTDNVILENYWDRSKPIFPTEQLELQAHGSKVYYRNIYVKELPRVQPFQLSDEEKKEDFQVLFDGTNMHEWTGNLADYRLEDGVISVYPSKSFGGNLYTKKEYGNFIFRFEFQLTPAANNGVGIRTPMEGDAAYVGMEIQILDDRHPVYKDITPLQPHGSVYGIIGAKRDALKPVGEWNYEEIYADGDHIRVTVNGKVVVDGNIREAVKNGTPDKKQHPGLFNKTGHIGFLGHGSPLKFRNIRIKELK